jgi:glycine/D-amino acid oxidase-like deaminating enzyme
MDETHKVAVTRLGDRIRVGGTAQLSGFDLDLEGSPRTLEFVVTDLFPAWRRRGAAEFWTGLRPMTPDGTPIVGAHPLRQPDAQPPATARWAGPWPPAPAASWPMLITGRPHGPRSAACCSWSGVQIQAAGRSDQWCQPVNWIVVVFCGSGACRICSDSY